MSNHVAYLSIVLVSTSMIWIQCYFQYLKIETGRFIDHKSSTIATTVATIAFSLYAYTIMPWESVLAYALAMPLWRFFWHHFILNVLYRKLPLGYLGVSEDGGGIDPTDSLTDRAMYKLGGHTFAAIARIVSLAIAITILASPYIDWSYFTTPLSELR